MSYNATCPIHPDSSDHIPIFVTHVMYQVACMYMRLAPFTSIGEAGDKTDALKQLLRLLGPRWRVASEWHICESITLISITDNNLLGVYLNILEAQEVMISLSDLKVRQACLISRIGPPPV
jgi:hypothetical protein